MTPVLYHHDLAIDPHRNKGVVGGTSYPMNDVYSALEFAMRTPSGAAGVFLLLNAPVSIVYVQLEVCAYIQPTVAHWVRGCLLCIHNGYP